MNQWNDPEGRLSPDDKEKIAAALTLAGTGLVLLVPKLCWLGWLVPLAVMLGTGQRVYVRKCAAHALAAALVTAGFMALCSLLMVRSGTLAGGNLIMSLFMGREMDSENIALALTLLLLGIGLNLAARIAYAAFLFVAAFRAFQWREFSVPIASALVKKMNKNYGF